jgi:hypothetical protein
VALWRRNLAELIAFFAAVTIVCAIILTSMHETGRVSASRFISQAISICVLQITIFVGSRAVTATARRAAEAEDALARLRTARLAADTVQAERRSRYEALRATVADLLEGLALGRLDLADAAIRQRIAVAVTRLRRYLVEADEVPDPLSHELRACADAAERRGIAVDLLAPVGSIPPLPVEVRRALTEPIIQVLAVTATQARITIVAAPDEVAVAALADAQLPVAVVAGGPLPLPAETTYQPETGAQLAAPAQITEETYAHPPAPAEATHQVADAYLLGPVEATQGSVQVICDVEEGLLWLQVRWTGLSPSPLSKTGMSSWTGYGAGSPTTSAAGQSLSASALRWRPFWRARAEGRTSWLSTLSSAGKRISG